MLFERDVHVEATEGNKIQSQKPKIILSVYTVLAGTLSWIAAIYGPTLALILCSDPEWDSNLPLPLWQTFTACSYPLGTWLGTKASLLLALTAVFGAIVYLGKRKGISPKYTALSLFGCALGAGLILLFVILLLLVDLTMSD